jgi:hypothetical protein
MQKYVYKPSFFIKKYNVFCPEMHKCSPLGTDLGTKLVPKF